jgi:rSAM/selenodomain-associated transferase 2
MSKIAENTDASNISVIVPFLNEAEQLPDLLAHLRQFSFGQVIWVDGGSTDDGRQWLMDNIKQTATTSELVIEAPTGRSRQLNKGAEKSSGANLLFLHADTRLPNGINNSSNPANDNVYNDKSAISEINLGLQARCWGRFDVAFSEKDWRMNIIAFFMNWRSRLTGIATGDQALFVRKKEFELIGGFPTQALMEDIEFCRRIKQFGKPYSSFAKVNTSARRWLKLGVVRTVLLMWRFRLQYFLGASPDSLAKQYRNIR